MRVGDIEQLQRIADGYSSRAAFLVELADVGKARMGFCPICNTSASLEQPSGGDYWRVECRKRGKFQITGSAMAMLPSRLSAEDKKTVARLSHATRLMSMTTTTEWPEINSVNLDDMLKQPLPSIDKQMTNFLVWAAAQLDDDQLGTIEIPDEEELTAVIGTIDGGRVDELISRTERDGLIEYVPERLHRHHLERMGATAATSEEGSGDGPTDFRRRSSSRPHHQSPLRQVWRSQELLGSRRIFSERQQWARLVE